MNDTTTIRNKIPIVSLGSVFSLVDILSVNNKQSKLLMESTKKTYDSIAVMLLDTI